MKKFVLCILTAVVCLGSAVCFTACGVSDSSVVRLVSVSAVEVGVRGGIDYFVVPEPAASTKVNAISGLDFAGDLQNLYGGGGYPQAVVVAKKEIANHYFAQVFADKLKSGAAWLLDEKTLPESIAEVVCEHLSDGMSPTFTAKNLSKQIIRNCSVKFTDAWDCKEDVISFMDKLNGVGGVDFGSPSDGFFADYADSVAEEYDGRISVYAPDGAPALGLAELMTEAGAEISGAEMVYEIVDASTVQTCVTGANPKADVCVLPVNLAVKLLGNGEKYKMLGTLTHGNLFLVSSAGEKITKQNLSSLRGKTVGVVNLAQVPGLTLKCILKDNGIDFEELQ